jgi:hypothetical protein
VADPLLAGDKIDRTVSPGRERHRVASARLTCAQRRCLGHGR